MISKTQSCKCEVSPPPAPFLSATLNKETKHQVPATQVLRKGKRIVVADAGAERRGASGSPSPGAAVGRPGHALPRGRGQPVPWGIAGLPLQPLGAPCPQPKPLEASPGAAQCPGGCILAHSGDSVIVWRVEPFKSRLTDSEPIREGSICLLFVTESPGETSSLFARGLLQLSEDSRKGVLSRPCHWWSPTQG